MDCNSRVVLLGSPLIDLTCDVSEEFLIKFNLKPDETYLLNETNNCFELIEKWVNTSKTIGGSVVNTARILRKLIKNPIIFLGSIGTDSDGKLIKSQLENEEIIADLVEIPHKPTGKVAVLILKNTRTLVTDLGASQFFPVEKLSESCIFFYMSLLFLNVSTKITEFLPGNNTIILNLGASFICRKFPIECRDLFGKAQLVFGNASEFRALAEVLCLEPGEIQGLLAEIAGFSGALLVVTRGDKSVFVVDKGEITEFPVRKIEGHCNTNGAGDAFVAGFLASFIKGEVVEKCIKNAIEVAQNKMM